MLLWGQIPEDVGDSLLAVQMLERVFAPGQCMANQPLAGSLHLVLPPWLGTPTQVDPRKRIVSSHNHHHKPVRMHSLKLLWMWKSKKNGHPRGYCPLP